MTLAKENLDDVKKRVMDAYKAEEPKLEKLRDFARQLKAEVFPIRNYSVNAVSFVSSDGGDNRINFNPGVIELVRVVDSAGNQCALDAVAENTDRSHLNVRIEEHNELSVAPLQKMCGDLGMKVTELSYLLGGLGKSGKSAGAIRVYRDILEWAVLYDLLHKEWGSDTIVVREGLLRTKSFKREVFPQIDAKIRAVCEAHKRKNVNVSIAGVAKQSAVLSKLTMALELEEVFHKEYPCYAKVPSDIEEYCYNFDRTWLDTLEAAGEPLYQSMGNLYLVKFGDRPFDPVWPVDIAVWDVSSGKAGKIIGQLLQDAQPGFPVPDFPQCIQKAHDHAAIGGIEMSVVQDIVFAGLMERMSEGEQEKIIRFRHLRENLTDRRYKHA